MSDGTSNNLRSRIAEMVRRRFAGQANPAPKPEAVSQSKRPRRNYTTTRYNPTACTGWRSSKFNTHAVAALPVSESLSILASTDTRVMFTCEATVTVDEISAVVVAGCPEAIEDDDERDVSIAGPFGAFPNIAAMLRKSECPDDKHNFVSLNPKLLQKVLDAFGDIEEITIGFRDDGGALAFVDEQGSGVAMLMPLDREDFSFARAAWRQRMELLKGLKCFEEKPHEQQ